MKKFFKWFKSSTRIKRWIFLMLIGIVAVCYSIATIISNKTNEFGFRVLATIIASFVFGVVAIVVSIIRIQRRTLELYVQESDSRDLSKKSDVSSLIYNKRVFNQGPKVVCIGGGEGLNVLLQGLKKYTDNITAILTISDYSKDGTDNAMQEKIKALNDVKGCMVSLAINEEQMAELLNYNMKHPNLSGLDFGDIYLQTMKESTGNLSQTVGGSTNIFNMVGKILPATNEPVKICAELENGMIAKGKENIPILVNEKVSRINRIFLSPTNVTVGDGVIKAIRDADAIVIGPGNLYTDVMPSLLVYAITRAIRESRAFKVYVSNIMTKMGETDSYKLSDHVKAIIDHAGKDIVEYCLYDTGEIVPEYVKQYNKEGAEVVEQDKSKVKQMGIKLIQRNLSQVVDGKIRHNPDVLATAIIELICDDLRFNDMENDEQFLLLNSKIKETKREIKARERKNKKIAKRRAKAKKNGKKQSKFLVKYNDRIEAIKEAEDFRNHRPEMVAENDEVEEVAEETVKKAPTGKRYTRENDDRFDAFEDKVNIEEDFDEEPVEEVKEKDTLDLNRYKNNLEVNTTEKSKFIDEALTKEASLAEEMKKYQAIEDKTEHKPIDYSAKVDDTETDNEEEYDLDKAVEYNKLRIRNQLLALNWIGDILDSKILKVSEIKLFDSKFSNGNDARTMTTKGENGKDGLVAKYKNSSCNNFSIFGEYKGKQVAIGTDLSGSYPYIAYNSSKEVDLTALKADLDKISASYIADSANKEVKVVKPKSRRNKAGTKVEVEKSEKKINTKVKHSDIPEDVEVQKIDNPQEFLDIINKLLR